MNTKKPTHTDKEIQRISIAVDEAIANKDADSIQALTTELEALLKRKPNSKRKAIIHYIIGSAWSDIRHLTTYQTTPYQWEQPEFEKTISHLRQAIKEPGHKEHPEEVQCRMHTNLANTLSEIGRVIEAREHWNRALEVDPDFGMALGNRGKALCHLARMQYDPSHQQLLFMYAWKDLTKAVTLDFPEKEAKELFKEDIAFIEHHFPIEFLEEAIDLNTDYSLGSTEEEQSYRKWCLDNTLFLNSMNDIGPFNIASKDILLTPNMTCKVGEFPPEIGRYSILKHEFTTARYMYYEGITTTEDHFSDKESVLADTLDFPVFTLAIERIKTAYLLTYSVFDKIARVLQGYLQLQDSPIPVYFYNVWCKDKENKLRDEFIDSENWILRALYWQSKDFFYREQEYSDSIEPEAQELDTLRHCITHSFVRVHENMWSKEIEDEFPDLNLYKDKEVHHITTHELKQKTLKLLKLARASLMYLIFAIRAEEVKKKANNKDQFVPSIPMNLIPQDRHR